MISSQVRIGNLCECGAKLVHGEPCLRRRCHPPVWTTADDTRGVKHLSLLASRARPVKRDKLTNKAHRARLRLHRVPHRLPALPGVPAHAGEAPATAATTSVSQLASWAATCSPDCLRNR